MATEAAAALNGGAPGHSLANSAPSTRSVRTMAWPFVATYGGLAAYLPSPHRDAFPAAIVSLLAFGLLPALLPYVRPFRTTTVCPLNWALFAFFLQLVVVPLLLCYLGPYINTLPILPSNGAINIALLMVTLGYGAFCLAYHSAHSRSVHREAAEAPKERVAWDVDRPAIVIVFLLIGVVGFGLTFSGFNSLLGYFSRASTTPVTADSVREAIGTVLRPFFGFGIVIAWCAWIERRRSRSRLAMLGVTGAAALLVLTSYATFSYNRGAFVAPLVSLAAVYGLRVRRIAFRTLLLLGLVGLAFLTAFRVYRTSGLTLAEAFGSQQSSLISHTNLNAELQIYSNAPQYLGFLLARTNYGAHLDYGQSILGSALSPVPKLGKSFRANSGVAKYNRLIYGDLGIRDQVIPFAGELFINFYWPGVVVGYALLGLAMFALQRGFARAPTAAQAFSWQYGAVWVAFLIVGGVEPVSQFFVFFFWPAYVLWSRAAAKRRQMHRPGAWATARRRVVRQSV